MIGQQDFWWRNVCDTITPTLRVTLSRHTRQ